MENMKELISKSILLDKNRTMYINIFFFENGCFIILSENSYRIGSITISSSLSNKVTKAHIIPSKYDSFFIDSVAQRISSMLNGLCLVSLHNKNLLNLNDMKIIMGEILDIINERAKDERK